MAWRNVPSTANTGLQTMLLVSPTTLQYVVALWQSAFVMPYRPRPIGDAPDQNALLFPLWLLTSSLYPQERHHVHPGFHHAEGEEKVLLALFCGLMGIGDEIRLSSVPRAPNYSSGHGGIVGLRRTTVCTVFRF